MPQRPAYEMSGCESRARHGPKGQCGWEIRWFSPSPPRVSASGANNALESFRAEISAGRRHQKISRLCLHGRRRGWLVSHSEERLLSAICGLGTRYRSLLEVRLLFCEGRYFFEKGGVVNVEMIIDVARPVARSTELCGRRTYEREKQIRIDKWRQAPEPVEAYEAKVFLEIRRSENQSNYMLRQKVE